MASGNYELTVSKCRICLFGNQEMNQFFEPYFDGFSIADILKTISVIQIQDDVGWPKLVCNNCTHTIMNFKYLLSRFRESEEYLKKLLWKKEESDDLLKGEQALDDVDNKSDSNDDEDYKDNDDPEEKSSQISDNDKGSETNISSEQNKEDYKEQFEVDDFSDNRLYCSSPEDTKEMDDKSELEDVVTTKYSCEICGDCFLFKSGFSHHMLMVHNICIQVNQYEQYGSSITVKVPKAFSDHVRFPRRAPSIPMRLNDFQCKKCKDNFSSAEELKKHCEIHKTFKCEQCGAAFIKNSYLRDHLLKHSTDKCYSCNTCGQAFKYRSALAVHKRDHMGNNRGHMCESCGRSFKERGTLKTHIMLKHTNERKFSCSACGLTFKLKAARDKHYMRKHTNNRTKDFVCSMCGMAYLNKETLTRHMNDKHSEVPTSHWCTVCEKSFTMKSNLFKHLRNKHNVITKND